MLTSTVVFQILNENGALGTPKYSANPSRGGAGGPLPSQSNAGEQRTRKDSFKIPRWV